MRKTNRVKKNDLTYLPYFKLKKKKKENRPTYPVGNFHQIVNTHIFFLPYPWNDSINFGEMSGSVRRYAKFMTILCLKLYVTI